MIFKNLHLNSYIIRHLYSLRFCELYLFFIEIVFFPKNLTRITVNHCRISISTTFTVFQEQNKPTYIETSATGFFILIKNIILSSQIINHLFICFTYEWTSVLLHNILSEPRRYNLAPGARFFLKIFLYDLLVLLNHSDELFGVLIKFENSPCLPSSPTTQLCMM